MTTVSEVAPTYRRGYALLALLASVTASGFALGGLMPLLAIILEKRGIASWLIGLNAALSTVAVLLVSFSLGLLLRRLGQTVLLYGGLAIAALATLAMTVWTSLEAWFVLRFLIGIGASVHWILSETWLNTIATPERRGLYAGIYGTLFTLGFVVAPIALSQMDLESDLPFQLAAGLIALVAVPLLIAGRDLPRIEHEGTVPGPALLLVAPTVFLAALVSGFADSALWALFAVYGLMQGLPEKEALLLLAVFSAGTVAMQIPIGWLADKGGRRELLLVSALAGAVGALLLPQLIGAPGAIWPLVFVWGGFMVALYTLGLAGLGDAFKGSSLAGANALFISIYSLGSILGPPSFGAGMDVWGSEALPYGIVICCLLLAEVALVQVLLHWERER